MAGAGSTENRCGSITGKAWVALEHRPGASDRRAEAQTAGETSTSSFSTNAGGDCYINCAPAVTVTPLPATDKGPDADLGGGDQRDIHDHALANRHAPLAPLRLYLLNDPYAEAVLLKQVAVGEAFSEGVGQDLGLIRDPVAHQVDAS
jgi:hypothetical protein